MTGMDRSARAWLVTVAADHYWRVARWYDFDDLLQDGYLCWYRIVEKYETETGRVRSRPHIMSLFKRTFLNHIHQLSKDHGVARVEVLAEDVTEGADALFDDVWTFLALPRNIDDYGLMVVEAPPLLQPLLRILFLDRPLPPLSSQYRVAADGSRDTLNARFCRLVGLDPERYDLVLELKNFLND